MTQDSDGYIASICEQYPSVDLRTDEEIEIELIIGELCALFDRGCMVKGEYDFRTAYRQVLLQGNFAGWTSPYIAIREGLRRAMVLCEHFPAPVELLRLINAVPTF